MKIVPVRAFRDNYIWLLTQGHYSVVVDPGDAAPVLAHLQRHALSLCGILITHHHADHIGGVGMLLANYRVPVYAPHHENFSFPYQAVGEGDIVDLSELETALQVLDVPGHTARHVAYYGGNSLFCGDTLFGCGCGRIFDGSCRQLYRSLQKLATLPDQTGIYCAHEYTLANLRFARMIDPDNAALKARESADSARIAQGLPTLPSTLGLEKSTNPFLRCGSAAIRQAARTFDPNAAGNEEAAFCAIRKLKNSY
ncbi:MAG TPA: hydroxyacylglutathione hydrolase [Novimethylophilus sp.]|uniref:hydroxyacylglutathione hydrolase n=1 Tax=Novimethylophilus sp. TaxID=2137426 RepID=UPI002F3FD37E